MKLLLLALNFPPEIISTGKYTGEMTAFFVKQGFDVRVVASVPYYPQWKIFDGYSGWRYTRETWLGAQVWRIPLWVPRRVGAFTRILHLLSFSLTSAPAMLAQIFWTPDVVLCVIPTLFSAPVAWLTAHLCGAKAWLHIQDFEMDAAFNLGFFYTQKILRAFGQGVESFILRRFDRVSTISVTMFNLLIQKGVAEERAYLFPNWADIENIFPMDAPSALRAEFGIDAEKKIVLYHGNMGYKQGLETVIESARLLEQSSPEIFFLLCGDGAARHSLEKSACGLSNLMFASLQPAERLNELVNLADIHVLPQRKAAADLVMPSKLTTMLASGKPVIACAAPGTQIWRVVSPLGVVTPPEDAPALSAAIFDLMRHPEKRAKMGISARDYACHFLSREHILTEFTKQLLEIPKIPAL